MCRLSKQIYSTPPQKNISDHGVHLVPHIVAEVSGKKETDRPSHLSNIIWDNTLG